MGCPRKYYRLNFLSFKLLIGVVILACMLCPMTIYRKEVNSEHGDFEMTYTGVPFRSRHHFCSMPDAKALSVNSDELTIALNLPYGTHISKGLTNFGECRAKLTKLNKDVSLCSCNVQFEYVIVILGSCISIVTQMFQIFFGPWKKAIADYSCFLYLCSMLWLCVACFATNKLAKSSDEMWLPNALYAQSYFQHPITWSVAIAFCYLNFVLTLVEVLLFCNLSSESDSKSSKVQHVSICVRSCEQKRPTFIHTLSNEPVNSIGEEIEKSFQYTDDSSQFSQPDIEVNSRTVASTKDGKL